MQIKEERCRRKLHTQTTFTFVLISLSINVMCVRVNIFNLLFIECHIQFHVEIFLNEALSAYKSVQRPSERKINGPLNYANRVRLCRLLVISLAWQLNSSWKRAIRKWLAKRGEQEATIFKNICIAHVASCVVSLWMAIANLFLFELNTFQNWCSYLFAHIGLWSRANVGTARVAVVRK